MPKPRILGADGAGVRVDTGERVVLNPGLEHGAQITVIGEHTDGTHCELIAVPASKSSRSTTGSTSRQPRRSRSSTRRRTGCS